MKKLAITSVAVLIALIGFTAILVCLPCNSDCCGVKDPHAGCEMRDGKCPEGKESCEGHKSEGCGKGQGHHDGCGGNEKCTVKEWKDADGKMHKEVKVIVGGDECGMGSMNGCPMENGDHSGCCGCCMMKHGGGMNYGNDSAGSDSIRIKVRGKL